MIVLAALIRSLLLKRLPKQCFRIMWIMAALRLLIPYSFTVEIPTYVHERPDARLVYVTDGTNAPQNAESLQSEPIQADYRLYAGTAAAAGTVLMGGFLIVAYAKMRRVALNSRVLSGYGKTDVRVGTGAAAPFSCGFLKPIVFIPEHMLDTDQSRLDLIVAHERHHIKCGDQLVKWLVAAAVCLNWYNPLVWLMWRLAERDIELACDEALVKQGFVRADYALCLIEAQESRCTAAVCSFGAPALSERIECIMKSKKITVCGFAAAALVLALMSVFFVQITAKEITEQGSTTDTVKYRTAGQDTPGDIADTDVYYFADETYETVFVDLTEEMSDVHENECERESVELRAPLASFNFMSAGFGSTNPTRPDLFHEGIDLAADEGTAVYAAASGTVITAEYKYDNGNYLVIDHGGGIYTEYCHCAELMCEAGDEVLSGEQIASVGSTGNATGPHLHFAIRDGEIYVSPEPLFE